MENINYCISLANEYTVSEKKNTSSKKILIMRREKILQSSLLDIIFENRNKDYGAYTLRNEYNKRLATAITSTIFIALVFVLMQSLIKPKNHLFVHDYTIVDDPTLTAVTSPDQKNSEPQKQVAQQKQFKTENYQNVQIVKEDIIDKNVDIKDLDNAAISTDTHDGADAPDGTVAQTVPNPGTATFTEPPVTPKEDNSIHDFAEVMPQYPGGQEALGKYIARNLNDKAQFEPGDKLSIRVSFVVDKDGSIADIVVDGADASLTQDVKKVLSKMPLWIPGRQNGQPVRVLFKLPVTFVGSE